MTYAEIYAYCIGQCKIKPAEYWKLSEAETIGIIAGHQRLESYDAEKFRNVFDAIIKGNGAKGNVKQYWPLPTDWDAFYLRQKKMTPEYLERRKAHSLEMAKKFGLLDDINNN